MHDTCIFNMSKFKGLNVYYQNIRGLRTKTHVFYRNICCNDYDIIILTETWLNSTILDGELFDDRYVVYRRDRETSGAQCGKEGGGVLIAVKNHLKSKRIQKWESNCEDLWIVIDLPGTRTVRRAALCAVYLPPPVRRSYLELFLDNCSEVFEQLNECHTYIVGDFNLSTIDWNKLLNSSTKTAPTSNAINELFLDFMNVSKLNQSNLIANPSGRILDLVLSTNPLCSVCECVYPLSIVDRHHPPLEIAIFLDNENRLPYKNGITRPNYRKADYQKICEFLEEQNWNELFKNQSDVNGMLDVSYEILNAAIKKYVPLIVPKNQKFPPWFSKNLIKLLNRKNRLRIRYKTYNNPLDALELKYLGKLCENLAAKCYYDYVRVLEHDLVKDPKLFWRYIKTKRGGSSAYPKSMTDGTITTSNGNEICELFATHFSSVYSPDHNSSDIAYKAHPSHYLENNSLGLNNLIIDENTVLNKLKSLDVNKGAGPDDIPSLLISKCSSALAFPLTIIYNKSLSSGTFPSKWKIAKIVPVYKSDSKENIVNYRPISILSTFAKIFESLVCPHIQKHLKLYLSDDQHGFVAHRSTSTNLVLYTELLTDTIDSGQQADVIYTDFSKAFDKVSHSMLISKLHAYGIFGPLLDWLCSYLSDRHCYVVVNGYQSSLQEISSGVPQGSHLGPVLFNFFINDISGCFHYSKIFMYADDLKAVKVVTSDEDTKLLQSDINRLVQWCSDNNMCLNTKKCFHMKFTRKTHSNIIPSEYFINSERIDEVDTIRDLGVLFDEKLTFVPHIDNVINKASKMLGFILRACKSFKKNTTKIMLFNSLVRSILEYCSVVWRPHYATHSLRLERVQKRFLWHLAFSNGVAKKIRSYKRRMEHFRMKSLANRRHVNDAIFAGKIFANKIDCPQLLALFRLRVPSRRPRNSITPLCPPRRKSVFGSNSPCARLCKIINSCSDKLDLHHDTLNNMKKVFLTFLSLE